MHAYDITDYNEKARFASEIGDIVGKAAKIIAGGDLLAFELIMEAAIDRYYDEYALGDYDCRIHDAFRDAAFEYAPAEAEAA